MRVKKSVFKLILFTSIISLIAFCFIRQYATSRKNTLIYTFFRQSLQATDTSYYFIGSSRVQTSIDPEVLKQTLGNKHIYNAGISGGTLLSNCIIARRLMQNKSPKVLFIELTPMLPEVPDYLLKHQDDLNLEIFGTANQLLSHLNFLSKCRLLLQLANKYVTSKLFIVDEVRNLMRINVEKTEGHFGFQPISENKYHSVTPFLKFQDFNNYNDKGSVARYQQYINELLKLGHQSNSKIVFFLPVTFRSEDEKETTIPIYKSLPDSTKLQMPEVLLKSMENASYLADNNHLNLAGAKVYSHLLAVQLLPFIKKE
ncbi:hypothetical protein KHS38_00730 [Mucilaginibacter sp. Bleaf8]|uniref:hypothetical protein n=1 Tax=Mucilaginibacter sp. Bleaf8 TaxID=2834430 RepID=UPI001BD17F97|nr:hypothetical protein [Mucilaginibacter sp. Bleaf8]MBS7562912.1 hypothetical protein [Mucilaginibacter sp. Bleaf8]